MDKINKISQVTDAFGRIKSSGEGLITNFYLNQKKLGLWINMESLFIENLKNTTFILRKSLDFYYFSYISKSIPTLGKDLETISPLFKHDLVIELVGEKYIKDNLTQLIINKGFILHETLVRMQRMKNDTIRNSKYYDSVEFAQLRDNKIIYDFLLERLDKYSEQILSIKEINTLITSESVLIIRKNSILAGLLIFENSGITSHLREWHVDDTFRNEKIGSKLINSYYKLSENCKRFILWVKKDNHIAKSIYQHYGYNENGLIDQIFLRKNE